MAQLTFGRAVPGTVRTGGHWQLRWDGCAVMGILNVTPDSFSDGGQHATLERALQQARRMLDAGALMLDIGGESTRPGAEPVDAATELDRVLPLLRALTGSGAVLSVDTLKPEVADACLRAGAHLINDVSGLRDPQMRRVCAEHGAAACIMHMQGEPRTMQRSPHYRDVVGEVALYLHTQAQLARADGVPGVLLDPGLGFGKTQAHNLALLRGLRQLSHGPDPLLVGASRKRFIGTLGGEPQADRRDAGSLAAHLYAARQGAAIVRVHDVPGHVQALRVQAALMGEP
ncbi:dihydropteroate synthase [Deinococcus sonorensis]|uniref:Dihydropteroate synthase n=2 Tax=Deinococcus sonorensis TaxID=309891 RepID=A0AAU7U8Q3_9DEIO